jgi:hypothetical protein
MVGLSQENVVVQIVADMVGAELKNWVMIFGGGIFAFNDNKLLTGEKL